MPIRLKLAASKLGSDQCVRVSVQKPFGVPPEYQELIPLSRRELTAKDVEEKMAKRVKLRFPEQAAHGRKYMIDDEELVIEIFRPDVANLELVDLPGLAPGNQADGQKIQKLVKKYMDRPSTLVLCVLEGGPNSLVGMHVLHLLPEVDSIQQRIIGIVTHADRLNKDAILEIVKSRDGDRFGGIKMLVPVMNDERGKFERVTDYHSQVDADSQPHVLSQKDRAEIEFFEDFENAVNLPAIEWEAAKSQLGIKGLLRQIRSHFHVRMQKWAAAKAADLRDTLLKEVDEEIDLLGVWPVKTDEPNSEENRTQILRRWIQRTRAAIESQTSVEIIESHLKELSLYDLFKNEEILGKDKETGARLDREGCPEWAQSLPPAHFPLSIALNHRRLRKVAEVLVEEADRLIANLAESVVEFTFQVPNTTDPCRIDCRLMIFWFDNFRTQMLESMKQPDLCERLKKDLGAALAALPGVYLNERAIKENLKLKVYESYFLPFLEEMINFSDSNDVGDFEGLFEEMPFEDPNSGRVRDIAAERIDLDRKRRLIMTAIEEIEHLNTISPEVELDLSPRSRVTAADVSGSDVSGHCGLFASRDFSPGEMVFSEPAVLVLSSLPEALAMEADWEAFQKLPEDLKRRVLDLHPAPYLLDEEGEVVDEEDFFDDLLFEVGDLERETFFRFLRIVKANAYDSHLYILTSRANHSCKPKCFRAVDRDVVSVRANCALKKGDEVTVSYLSDELEALPQDVRERHLPWSCWCASCASPVDSSRAFKCPHSDCQGFCFARQIDSLESETQNDSTGELAGAGSSERHNASGAASVSFESCTVCGRAPRLERVTSLVSAERSFRLKLESLWDRGVVPLHVEEHFEELSELLKESRATLGSGHWLVRVAAGKTSSLCMKARLATSIWARMKMLQCCSATREGVLDSEGVGEEARLQSRVQEREKAWRGREIESLEIERECWMVEGKISRRMFRESLALTCESLGDAYISLAASSDSSDNRLEAAREAYAGSLCEVRTIFGDCSSHAVRLAEKIRSLESCTIRPAKQILRREIDLLKLQKTRDAVPQTGEISEKTSV
uniref:SET domain-containing protein n=1 Tax=Chromera velia CCMP2878 TaxID=1169474 RepID=A0A0G4IBN4_9ALVE|eukprot:Cvel_12799.t1-p1 / transcript=Cvel_12799.t1 / gene=Cvel_12799 / organism=Chromera_velia_CCMP2878 / gene_product=Interferon-induced GTP-binding protein Mx, putative / transcript_product=Interferon-induced GTP-binding protein Mx, putative / location=Cvel_scaffold852:24039-30172(+) / protein_length=1072 / sequence_SO=supercontig / SO=protein_coding / is_pseudo=false